jgi:hypothetical protein
LIGGIVGAFNLGVFLGLTMTPAAVVAPQIMGICLSIFVGALIGEPIGDTIGYLSDDDKLNYYVEQDVDALNKFVESNTQKTLEYDDGKSGGKRKTQRRKKLTKKSKSMKRSQRK